MIRYSNKHHGGRVQCFVNINETCAANQTFDNEDLHLKDIEVTKTCKTEVQEENNGCLKLAQMEPGRMTTMSKYYNVQYQWFDQK